MQKRRKSLMTERIISANLGAHQQVIDEALNELLEHKIIQRIWERDFTVWKSEPDEISNRLGWLDCVYTMVEKVTEINEFVKLVRENGYTNALLLGMGGSSLAPEVFRKTFGVREGFLNLAVLDSTDPDAILTHMNQLDLDRTLFIVSTKSGGTVETLSFFKFFYTKVVGKLGESRTGERFIAITDPGSSLENIATRYHFLRTFLNDPNIGGRYSALSYFGLLPAALLGIDLEMLLDRAKEMAGNCTVAGNNGAGLLGTIMGELALKGMDKLTFIMSPTLASFGNWLEQLIAESTGKEGKGILPVVGESLGSPDVYGEDRLFVYLRLGNEYTYDSEVQILEEVGFPVVQIQVRDVYDIGGQIFLWEMATAVAGQRLGINPFDQPDVESAKVLAREMVKAYQATSSLPEDHPVQHNTESLKTFLDLSKSGDYISLQAYVNPSPEMDTALNTLRLQLRNRYKLATTVGYGPRFLHSTGQLHKGDSGKGLFIQYTSDPEHDLVIPDEPGEKRSSMTFALLKMAQALGDKQALLNKGRRIIRFHLGHDFTTILRGVENFLD